MLEKHSYLLCVRDEGGNLLDSLVGENLYQGKVLELEYSNGNTRRMRVEQISARNNDNPYTGLTEVSVNLQLKEMP